MRPVKTTKQQNVTNVGSVDLAYKPRYSHFLQVWRSFQHKETMEELSVLLSHIGLTLWATNNSPIG